MSKTDRPKQNTSVTLHVIANNLTPVSKQVGKLTSVDKHTVRSRQPIKAVQRRSL